MLVRICRITTSLLVLCAMPCLASARTDGWDNPIVTDRPDVTESSQTVGAWRFQMELGTLVGTGKSHGRRETFLSTPIKARLGIFDPIEIHLETLGFGSKWLSDDGGSSSNTTGVHNLAFGFKLHFFDQDSWLPSAGLLVSAIAPLGTDGLGRSPWAILPSLAADWQIGSAWGVGTNLGTYVPFSERGETSDSVIYTLTGNRSWAPLSNRVATFLEFFGETAFLDGETLLALDGGFTWLVLPNLQLDLFVGAGLTAVAPDVFGGAGVSFKL